MAAVKITPDVAERIMALAPTMSCREYERHFNRKKQSFLAFRFENLDAAGVVRFWMRKQEGELSVLGGAAASGS